MCETGFQTSGMCMCRMSKVNVTSSSFFLHCAHSTIIIQTAIFVSGHVMQDEKDESFAHQ